MSPAVIPQLIAGCAVGGDSIIELCRLASFEEAIM
jgi:hypothetical protein